MEPYDYYNEQPFPKRINVNKITPIRNKIKPNGISYIINPIDSYSELYKNTRSKYTKLDIDQMESKNPRLIHENPKKSYVIKKKARCDSNLKSNNRNNKNISNYLKIGSNKRHYNRSAKDVFNYSNNNEMDSMTLRESKYNKQIEYNNEIKNIYRNNNSVRKNKDINLYPKQEETLYDNYKELIKLNTFRKLTRNNNINNVYRKYTKINTHPDINKKLVKIQAVWRGTFFRALMSFYWNVDNFSNILNGIFKTHIYYYFFDFIKNITHFPKKDKGEYTFNEYQLALNKKEENYNILLEKYNTLVEKFTELQNKNLREEKRKKLFNEIKIQKQDKFNINKEIVNQKDIKIREKYKNRKREIYQNYIEHFTRNIKIMKNEQIILGKSQIKNEKNKILNNYTNKNIFVIEKQENMNIEIKYKKKKRCEKMTEITSELNPILSSNNIELYFKRILKKKRYINKKEQDISFIHNKSEIIFNNINLEINKEEILAINPYTIKKSKIKKESNIELLSNRYAFYTRIAKNNLIKIVLPIIIKIILKKFAYKYIFTLLLHLKNNK